MINDTKHNQDPIEEAAINERIAGVLGCAISVFLTLREISQAYFLSTILFILKNGFDPKSIGTQGETLLHIAVLRQHPKAVEVLLNNGADVNSRNLSGDIPLYLAIKTTCTKVVKALLRKKYVQSDLDTALLTAVRRLKTEYTRLLLNAGADMNLVLNSFSLFFYHCTKNNSIVSYLLSAVKMTLANVSVNLTRTDRRYRRHFQTTWESFERLCLSELDELKRKKFDNVSLYDIFSEWKNPLLYFFYNDLKVYINSKALTNDFPLYAVLVRRKFNEGAQRLFLLDNMRLSVRVMRGLNVLKIEIPNEITRKILMCLEHCDLVNVKRAFSID